MSLIIAAWSSLVGKSACRHISGVPTNAIIDPSGGSAITDPSGGAYITEP